MLSHLKKNVLLCVFFLFFTLLLVACGGKESSVADHIKAMDSIMTSNMDSPKDGVEELREYIHDNLPEMMEQMTELAVELQKIEDDGERKERAKEIIEALTGPITTMSATAEKFQAKAAGDKEAMELIGKMGKRMEMFGSMK